MNYYKRYPGDYGRDTGHLSLAEHGAYTLLLDRYYSVGSLPREPRELYVLCRAFSKSEREAVNRVMEQFFPDGKNHRADLEIAKWNEKATQNKTVGKLGGRPKKNPDGFPEKTQTVSKTEPTDNPLQNPEAIYQKPEGSLHDPLGARGSHAAFERIKAAYPKFAGRQDWINAENACQLRIGEGVSWATLLAGVERYAIHIRHKGSEGTQYVLTPGKFFSAADEPWKQEWPIPLNRAQQKQNRNLSASEEWLRQQEADDAAH